MKQLLSEGLKRFNYLISEINAVYHEASLKLGLSDSAMQILYALCNHGDSCLLNDICKLSGLSKQTINSALRKLEEEDILYLESFSGKKKKVCLTEKGKALAKDTALRIIELENEIFASWDDKELETYLELVQRYLVAFRDKVREF